MLPFLTFSAGLIAGAAAISALRNERVRARAAQLQTDVRQAGAAGLDAAKRTTTSLRARFAKTTAAAAETVAAAPAEATEAAAKPRRTAKAKPAAAKAKTPTKPRAKAKAKAKPAAAA